MIKLHLLTLAAVIACSGTAGAQPGDCRDPVMRASVVVRDNGTGADTLWFGFDPTATCGIDPHLCEYASILPPSGVFAARWRAPNPSDSCEPGHDRDYLPSVSRTAVQRHLLAYQPGEGGYPFTFSWNPAQVRAICDSIVLADLFGGIFVRARMDSIDHVQVSHPAITALQLTVYGQRPSPWDCTEPAGRQRLVFRDTATGRDTLWWYTGWDSSCGLDSALCEGAGDSLWPPPQGVFDVRFAGGSCTTGAHRAYFPVPWSSTQGVRIRMQAGDAGYPIIVRWDTVMLWGVDNVLLEDEFGGALIRRIIRWGDSGELMIMNPGISSLWLRFYGEPVVVHDPGNIIVDFSLG